MLSPRLRGALERYALASRALSRASGERVASEAGQSVEFHDFRPYQAGDELRYVDWRSYARSKRLYTRLYQAERTISLHLLLDTSPSMSLGVKAAYARQLAELLSYVAQRDSLSQVHLFDGRASPPLHGRARIAETWRFIAEAGASRELPVAALKRFALGTRFAAGAGLVLVISDLFDEASLQGALAALRSRGLDASFLHLMAERDLEPEVGQLELLDVESGERLFVSPEEVLAYRRSVRAFVERSRRAVLGAGFRYSLLRAGDAEDDETLGTQALAALVRAGILVKR